jgi:hypothetical protein
MNGLVSLRFGPVERQHIMVGVSSRAKQFTPWSGSKRKEVEETRVPSSLRI